MLVADVVKFLLVDDDPPTVSALKALLEGDGHDVEAFTSAPDALSALAAGSYDAVLTDFEMPHVTGDAVVRAARTHQPRACVFVSTSRRHLLVAGAACHVFDKPLDYDAVLRSVAECRARRGPGEHGHCYMKVASEEE